MENTQNSLDKREKHKKAKKQSMNAEDKKNPMKKKKARKKLKIPIIPVEIEDFEELKTERIAHKKERKRKQKAKKQQKLKKANIRVYKVNMENFGRKTAQMKRQNLSSNSSDELKTILSSARKISIENGADSKTLEKYSKTPKSTIGSNYPFSKGPYQLNKSVKSFEKISSSSK